MSVELFQVDYANAVHADQLVMLLNQYACDPMGGAKPLPDSIKASLAESLSNVPGAFSLIATVDGQPAGLTNCFEGFSTFACQPLINVHDLAVSPDYRGQGISQVLLRGIEAEAKSRGCIKVTLEVLGGNTIAKNAYQKYGFESYELDPSAGSAELWQKYLD